MSDSIKKILVFFLMFLFILSMSSLASNLKLREIEVIFSDGSKTHLTVSSNKTAEEILKENNIVVLDDEVIRKSDDLTKIFIDKNNKNSKIIKTEFFNTLTSKDIDNNYVTTIERIEIEQVEIPFNTVTKTSKETEDTNSMVVQIGENGIKELKYKAIYKKDELVERTLIEEKVIKEPKDKIVQLVPKVTSRSLNRYDASAVSYNGGKWNYTEAELDLICAITSQESSRSYEGALAVITTACNRTVSKAWKSRGADPLTQLKAKGQFSYSIDNHWKKRLNGNYPAHVKRAVIDALNGKRNHNFLSFRSASTGVSGVNIAGNVYFNSL